MFWLVSAKPIFVSTQISPLIIKFNKIAFLNEFFRCLFFEIKPNHIFNNARSLALNTFLYEDHDFIPHLSLAYGSISVKTKTEIKLFVETNLRNVNILTKKKGYMYSINRKTLKLFYIYPVKISNYG